MYTVQRWFHMELIINSNIMGKGGNRLGILILSCTKCRFHVYYIQGWVEGWEFSSMCE